MIAAVANSLAVLMSSQLILATSDINIEASDPADSCPYTLDARTVQRLLFGNMSSHVAPLLLTFIIMGIMIKRVPCPFEKKWTLFVSALFFILCFTLIYMTVPITGVDGANLTFERKYREVYYNDNIGVMLSLPAYFIFFLFFVVWLDR